MLLHRARLDRRRMRTQQQFIGDVESVLHIAGRMIFRQVHLFEVVAVFFDFRSVDDFVSHSEEQVFDFFIDLRQDVCRALGDFFARQGDIDRFSRNFSFHFFNFKRIFFGLDGGFNIVTQFICQSSDDRAFFRTQIFHPSQSLRDWSFFSQIRNTDLIQ